MAVRERLREFIKYKGISERAFCSSIGVSFSYVNSIRKSVQPDKMKAITKLYPELNPLWLMTGDGEMIIPIGGPGNMLTNTDVSSLITMLKEKDMQINRLISVIERLSEK